ncbi:MAG: sigma-70 family RNA polymerase sigma factor [bacterium]
MAADLVDRQHLAERHLGLVKSLAAKLLHKLPASVELDDIIGYGHKGLMEACERFDPTRGLAFSTYAYYRIQGAMYDGLRKEGGLPRSVVHRFRAQERAEYLLENAAEREAGARMADPAALATRSTADTLRELTEHIGGLTAVLLTSLDAENAPQIPDERASAELHRTERSWLSPKVRAALRTLPERERELVDKVYYQGMNLKDAGESLGMSKSWASRLHARAMNKLHRALTAVGVESPDG